MKHQITFDGTPTIEFLEFMLLNGLRYGLIAKDNLVIGIRILGRTKPHELYIGQTAVYNSETRQLEVMG